jgi:choline-sulfatase
MRPSNLLFICSDEHQARAMGCSGHPLVRTPNLDALAARGTRFADAYTPSPVCVPARASMATGRYVHQTRCWDNAAPYDGSIPSWGHALQEIGVRVESIGKLHYRSTEDSNGFDALHRPMMVLGGVGMAWASIRREHERVIAENRILGDHVGPGKSKYIDYDAGVAAQTVEWLHAHADPTEPWCLYVGLVAPHFPLICPEEFFDLYPLVSLPPTKLHPKDGYKLHPWIDRVDQITASDTKFRDEQERLTAIAAYFGLTSWLDHNVGKILEALEKTGLATNTTVIYTSDHGDNVGARGLWGKSNFYKESVSVPLIMAGPAIPSSVCYTPVSLIDIPATIAEHFGTHVDGAEGIRSLDGIATEPQNRDRIVFSEYHGAGAVSGGFMIKKGRWKFHHYVGFPPELFDLQNDPEEIRDLAGDPAFRDVVVDMEAELRRICNPEEVNARAFADQDALVERLGGREAALQKGARGATPPPA